MTIRHFRVRTPLFCALGVAAAPSCFADDPPKITQNDQTNYQGDRVQFQTDMIVKVEQADGTSLGYVCLPKGTPLRGRNLYSTPGPGADSSKVETGSRFLIIKKGRYATCSSHLPATGPDDKPLGKDASSHDITWQPADMIDITDDQLTRFPPDRYGFTFGALAVPFKYHLTGNKDFTGSATVGPYAGYRTTGPSFGLSYVGFLAYSNISVAQNVNGASTTQNLAGVSYGLGLVATLKGSFQIGGVLGFDRVNSSAGYQYNGKPWLAVELGYSFLQ